MRLALCITFFVILTACSKISTELPMDCPDGYEVICIKKNYFFFFNPYKNKGNLHLKGAMHIHTDNSCALDGYGSGDPYLLSRKFRDEGNFDFYTYTDHNYVTKDPQIDGIIWLGNAVEDTRSEQHLCVYNLPDNYTYYEFQANFQEIINYYRKLNSVVSYAHPNWDKQYQSNDKIKSVKDISFVEVYNYDTGGSERAFAILQEGASHVFGIGVDDYHRTNLDTSFDKACVYVYAKENNRQSIWDSLLSGCFYASKGAKMDIECINYTIRIKVDVDSDIDLCVPDHNQVECFKVKRTFHNCRQVTYKIDGKLPVFWFKVRNTEGTALSQSFKLVKSNV